MQEIHAVNNGDGTYTVQIIARFKDGFRQYVTQYAYISMDCALDDIQAMREVHFNFNDSPERNNAG